MSSRNVRQKTAAAKAEQAMDEACWEALTAAEDLSDCERLRHKFKQFLDEADTRVVSLGGECLGQRDERTHQRQCPDRSLQTHDVKLTPPTNEHVLGGRCLLCNRTSPVAVAATAAKAGSSSSRATVVSPLPVPEEAAKAKRVRFRENFTDGAVSGEYIGDVNLCNPTTPVAVAAAAADAEAGSSSSKVSVVSPLPDPEETEQAKSTRFFDSFWSGAVWGDYIGDLDTDGRRHGKGKIIYEGGAFYDGQWENGERNGQGSCRYRNGWTHDGGWKNGKREGRGVRRRPDGTKHYEGGFKNDLPEGHGASSWPSGDKFEGWFREGKREGQGVITWANGDSYTGGWKGGEREGKGIHKYADGRVEIRIYTNGNISGQGVRWSANRRTAWLLGKGKIPREIELSKAKALATGMGFADVPQEGRAIRCSM